MNNGMTVEDRLAQRLTHSAEYVEEQLKYGEMMAALIRRREIIDAITEEDRYRIGDLLMQALQETTQPLVSV